MTRRIGRMACWIFLVCQLFAQTVFGQAFCALRDPVRSIYDLFPEASTYRSLVRTIDDGARDAIATNLNLELHHAELGKHTMYAVFDGDIPVGLVQVRAERTKWGLVEVAWALTLDLTVRDFRFQRCRSPSEQAIASEAFRSALVGTTADDLATILSMGQEPLERLHIAPEHHPLAAAVISSGLKTIAVTREVWGEELSDLRAAARPAR